MEKKNSSDWYHVKYIAFVLCLILAFAGIGIFSQFTYHLPIFEGVSEYYESNWLFGEKDGEMSETKLSDHHFFEPGKTYVLSTALTYSGAGDDFPSALFTVGNYEVRVFLDDVLKFQYTREERGFPLMQSMGGAAFSIPLGEQCAGKELKLELETSMKEPSMRRMPGIRFGDHSAIMRDVFLQNVPGIFISLAIFFVAVVLVLLGNSNPQKRWAYLFFAVFALIIVIYRSSQDLFVMYMWADPIVTICLEFFSLVICPLPVLLSYRFEMKPYFKNTFAVLIGLSLINIMLQMVLHFCGIRDVVKNLHLTHSWIFICTVILLILGMRMKKLDPSNHCMQKLIPILVGGAMDFLLFYIKFYLSGPGSLFMIGNFIGLGLLTSLSMMVWEARIDREKVYAASERSKLLEKVAYEDALTGIANRAAFTREIDEIQAGVHRDHTVLTIEADLNDLKKVNDNLGHAAGDELIQRAAALLHDSFHQFGRVYRTGGDEFFAILYDVTEAQWESMKIAFYQNLQKCNKEHSIPLSIALGHAFMEDSIEKSMQLADKRMYQDKTAIKEGSSYGFCSQ